MTKAPRKKLVHRAKHVNAGGQVSALCFKRRHAIDLKRASWTIDDYAVTCRRCIDEMHFARPE